MTEPIGRRDRGRHRGRQGHGARGDRGLPRRGIAADEPRIQAFAHLDPDACPRPGRALDDRKRAGQAARAPLHGVPVAVKDIVDTADFPTEQGSVIQPARRPLHDAVIVSRLRAAGAVVLGKTVTTEFACFTPGKTRNPHDPSARPGGSSSGSAAAVAAGMAPLAIGSQTNGSVIRPASFCGVVGFKPSYGLIPRTGVLTTSAHAGPCRRLRPLGRGCGASWPMCWRASTTATRRPGPVPPPPCAACALTAPPVTPRLAFVRGPTWGEAEAATAEAFAELAESLGASLVEVALPEPFGAAVAVHRTIWTCELAFHLAPEYERGRAQLSDRLRQLIEAGLATPAPEYQKALATRRSYQAAPRRPVPRVRRHRHARGPGRGAGRAGRHRQPRLLHALVARGTPAVSLPILRGPAGLPLGVQLVGAMGDDARLLRTARWLVSHIAAATEVASG